MKQITLTTTIFLLLCSKAFGQKKKDLNIDFMLRGHIYAKSSVKDTTALGGFGDSDNLPKKITGNLALATNGLILKIDTAQTTKINGKYNGYKLYIANKTDTIVRLDAADSRLNVVAEVFYKGKWKPIEYLPSSTCGNSYHNVYLKQDEYWEFDIPKFTGNIKTMLRYKLILDKDKYLYSNEILTSINKGQLKNKEGYKPNGIMDPYSD
ncbi:hypothetical protein [Chryseobacterium nepalense]|uniref:Uncharacterized protein n=1 Tax=Chryseobacterium nepalense TaxID=1854498 RepID=A0ABY4KDG2_9FLAO|nr:hypothetical protein [Chryseobacterium nepalense]UPQ77425.1 hypothetical protein M0D58_07795 [Chryseobacterium nepalense]